MAESTMWRECANWMERCRVIKIGSYPSNADVRHFAQDIRDGVLLCHLITRLDAEALDFKDVCLRPQMAQVITANRKPSGVSSLILSFSLSLVHVSEEHSDIPACMPQTFRRPDGGSVRGVDAFRLHRLREGAAHSEQAVEERQSPEAEHRVSLVPQFFPAN